MISFAQGFHDFVMCSNGFQRLLNDSRGLYVVEKYECFLLTLIVELKELKAVKQTSSPIHIILLQLLHQSCKGGQCYISCYAY